MKLVKKMDDYDSEITVTEDSSVAVVITPQVHNQIDIYLTGEIGESSKYLPAYHTLVSASPDDVVYLHINSEGGNADTAIQFRHSIQNCPAMVVGVVQGTCMSAASMILLACDSFVVADFSILMCHNYRGISAGKGSEMFDQITFTRKWSEDMVREIYRGFLTEEEIVQIMEGKDLWMGHAEARERLQKFVELRGEKDTEDGEKNEVETR